MNKKKLRIINQILKDKHTKHKKQNRTKIKKKFKKPQLYLLVTKARFHNAPQACS
jgi:hypothetical protein